MSSSAALIRQLKEDTVIRYPRDVEEALGELTSKQRRFAVMVGAGVGKIASYREVYDVDQDRSDESIAIEAYALHKNPKVSLSIGLVANWVDARILADSTEAADFCLRKWLFWANDDADRSSAIRATEMIAKASGLFISRSEITHRHVLDLDAADSQLNQMLADLGLDDTIDAVFHVEHPQDSVEQSRETSQVLSNQQLTKPTLGVCPHCGHAL